CLPGIPDRCNLDLPPPPFFPVDIPDRCNLVSLSLLIGGVRLKAERERGSKMSKLTSKETISLLKVCHGAVAWRFLEGG
ncbi:hypothetical protein L2E82_43171, partial [Cichorium intybus]